jgi:hypothetical protein
MAKIGLPDFDLLVDHEKQRIDKLEWMQSAAKLKLDKAVWHIQPLTLSRLNGNQCLCGRDIELKHLESAIEGKASVENLFSRSSYADITSISADIFLKELNAAMNFYGVSTCLDKMHFLAQCLVETDFFRTTEEYKNKDGTTPSKWDEYGGGSFYHGRGLIQITHKKITRNIWRQLIHCRLIVIRSRCLQVKSIMLCTLLYGIGFLARHGAI